jgi:hypothetical protein
MSAVSRPDFLAAAPPRTAPQATARLALHEELYLFAHDIDSGAAHIHPRSLAVGLAGAVLIELVMARRVSVRDEHIEVSAVGQPAAGAIAAAALAAISGDPTRRPPVGVWLRGFGDPGLYERVRANLVAVGILYHRTRRLRADVYPAVHHAWTVRIGAHLRSVLTGWEESDAQCAALCGLVEALGLYEHLFMAESAAQVRHGLRAVASAHLPPVRHVTATVGRVMGDLATSVYG